MNVLLLLNNIRVKKAVITYKTTTTIGQKLTKLQAPC